MGFWGQRTISRRQAASTPVYLHIGSQRDRYPALYDPLQVSLRSAFLWLSCKGWTMYRRQSLLIFGMLLVAVSVLWFLLGGTDWFLKAIGYSREQTFDDSTQQLIYYILNGVITVINLVCAVVGAICSVMSLRRAKS